MAICRTPAFGKDEVLEKAWDQLKEKIKESSPAFYQSIKNINADEIDGLPAKMRFTIWKYFSRSKFRATPFGSFSALQLLPIAASAHGPIILSEALTVKRFRDWDEKDTFISDISDILSASTLFYRNSSCYEVMDEIRYIRLRDGKFELSTVKSFPQLKAILDCCSSAQSLEAICKVMKADFELEKKHTQKLLGQLISIQLILTDRFPNIIGEDYFSRLGSPNPSNEQSYAISSRQWKAGALQMKSLENMPKLIQFLSDNLPATENEELLDFKKAFLKKFDRQEVPLSVVMDPETGISYGRFEQQPGNEVLDSLKAARQKKQNHLNLTYTKLHSFILDQLSQEKTICLEKFEGTAGQPSPLSNTLSVIFHFHNGQPVIANIHGTTATALAGRFTMLSPTFHRHVRQIAELEEKANPSVFFFDIAYQAENRIDNVNRRQAIYSHELPILTWSCNPDQLDFSDILVSIVDQKVVLRSKKYNKRLIPRIPSAYNYSRSDLAAYRFLCDVQNQGIQTNLGLDLSHYFPGLSYYPRISYMNMVISPAMWKMPKKFMQKGIITPNERQELSKWLKEKGIDSHFKVGDTDQTLCFDSKTDVDLEALLMYCKQQSCDQLYLAEALMDDDTVKDENGRAYLAQFIVNYHHGEELYQDHSLTADQGNQGKVKALWLPGSDWLYYELYCYPTKSNSFLVAQISTFLRQVKFGIHKWFFIRYDQPGPHLRLRLHLKDPVLAMAVNRKLITLFSPFIESGQLIDLSIRPYQRELERYGETRMEAVEHFFHLDSEYVLSQLFKHHAVDALYLQAISYIRAVLLSNLGAATSQLDFVKKMAACFAKENRLSPIEFKEINQSYNQLKDRLEAAVPISGLMARKKAISKILVGTTEGEKQRLIADLLHMHINRLFPSDQRLHETIVYHYLLRMLLVDHARSKILVE